MSVHYIPKLLNALELIFGIVTWITIDLIMVTLRANYEFCSFETDCKALERNSKIFVEHIFNLEQKL